MVNFICHKGYAQGLNRDCPLGDGQYYHDMQRSGKDQASPSHGHNLQKSVLLLFGIWKRSLVTSTSEYLSSQSHCMLVTYDIAEYVIVTTTGYKHFLLLFKYTDLGTSHLMILQQIIPFEGSVIASRL